MGADIRSTFAPGISTYVETMLRHGKIGICAGTLRLLDVETGCSSCTMQTELYEIKQPNADRFKLVIPYGGQSVMWEIIFNSAQPLDPPDFIFDDEEFLPNIENIQTLNPWEPQNPNALLNVINELMEEYRSYQNKLIERNSRLEFEYNSLMESKSFHPDDVEVFVAKRGVHRSGQVSFLIKLPIQFSRIPAYLQKDNPGEDAAVLVITFQSMDGGKVTPQLFLSPRVENAIGGSSVLRIPAFPAQGCLFDYVPLVCELLESKIEKIVHGFEKKKEYISAFISKFCGSVVEYDVESYSRICFLMEWHDFFFQLAIELPVTFPADQPVFTFISVYHVDQNGAPFFKTVRDYPYSPRWSVSEMADRARTYILEFIGTFQRASVKEGTISSE